MRISDWSSDVCSSDLPADPAPRTVLRRRRPRWPPPWLDRCTRQSGTSVSLIRTPREAAMMKLYYDETMNPRKVCAVARYLDSPVDFIRVDLGKGQNKTRSEERRVGKRWFRTGRFCVSPYP